MFAFHLYLLAQPTDIAERMISADRETGRRITVPTLAIWQDPGGRRLPFDPEAVWRDWTTDLRTLVLPGGHFLPEAQPAAVTDAIRELVDRPSTTDN